MSLNNNSKSSYLASLFMCGCLYFIFGFVSWVNSILIPYFKVACDLHNEVLGYLVAFAFYIAYLVMSIPASIMLNKIGFKRGVEYGLWVMAMGALLFVPAAMTRTYALFLAGLFSFGIGLAILQTAANPFVTIIGPYREDARVVITPVGAPNFVDNRVSIMDNIHIGDAIIARNCANITNGFTHIIDAR